MPDIYPDLSSSKFDVKYAQRKILASDLKLSLSVSSGGGRYTEGLDGGSDPGASMKLIDSFRIGVGQPMENGDTTYTNTLLENNNFIVFADGVKIHQITDDPTERYCTKAFTSDTITINGGVNEREVIEIYLIP